MHKVCKQKGGNKKVRAVEICTQGSWTYWDLLKNIIMEVELWR